MRDTKGRPTARGVAAMVTLGAALGCSGADSGDAGATSGAGGASSSMIAVTSSVTGIPIPVTTSSTGGAPPIVPYPAPHPPLPTLVSTGGPLVATPKVVQVYFSNDDPSVVASLKDYTSKLGPSQYWRGMVGEYGVGSFTTTSVDLPDTLTGVLDDTDIQSWLTQRLESGDGLLPPPDDETIYLLFFPEGVGFTITGSQSCRDYLGYHNSTKLDVASGGANVIYAPIARCPQEQQYTELDLVTAVTSHELAEATTDPFFYTNPAYQGVDPADGYWEVFLQGGEIADLCGRQGAFAVYPDEIGYAVEHAWSNKAAAASHDPCAPSDPTIPYFNTAPVLPDHDILIFGLGVSDGVRLAVGQSTTIELDVFSDAPTDDLRVDVYGGEAQGTPPNLDLQLDKGYGHNGDKLNLTITLLSQSSNGYEPFAVVSTLKGVSHGWPGMVGP